MSGAVEGFVGRPMRRREDDRLLRGQGRFVADLRLDRMASAVFVRSTVAHASIVRVDTDAAAALPGVIAVLTAADLDGVRPLTRKFYRLTPEFVRDVSATEGGYREPILADGLVSRVGQPIVMIVAEDRWTAEDARDLVEVDYDLRPVVSDPESAMADGAALVDPEVPGNVHSSFVVATGDVLAAEAEAHLVVERTFRFGRSIGSPMENRGVIARWTPSPRRLEVWSATQIPYVLRANLAECLDMPEHEIGVDVPDMGGSFGGGIYPEEIAVAAAARLCCRTVSWTEERSESIVNARHSRDVRIAARLGLGADGRALSLRLSIVLDAGCCNPFGLTLAYNIASHARSVYRIDHFAADAKAVLTNKTRNTPVRGAGRPEATLVIDRLLDIAARELRLDPTEIRRRNLVPAQSMPYALGIPYRDGVAAVYDSGDFPRQFERLLHEGRYEHWRAVQAAARAEGRFIGIGMSCHVEGTGLGPHEGAHVRVERDGSVTLVTGAQPHGQGHHTVLAQVLADELQIDPSRIAVRSGSTTLLPFGGGTFGSRSAVTASAAVHLAGEVTKRRLLEVAGQLLEIATEDLSLSDGWVVAAGAPDRRVSFAEIATSVAPGPSRPDVPGGVEVGALEYFVPPTVTFGSGSHLVVLEVDPVRWSIEYLDYVTVDDCGRALNEMVVDGQVIGGLVHGVSNTFLEELEYDDDASPTNASLVEYLLATAAESPRVRVFHENHPTPLNPLGVKGIGEGATSSAPAALVNALCDALAEFGVDIVRVPVVPWDLGRLDEGLPTTDGQLRNEDV